MPPGGSVGGTPSGTIGAASLVVLSLIQGGGVLKEQFGHLLGVIWTGSASIPVISQGSKRLGNRANRLWVADIVYSHRVIELEESFYGQRFLRLWVATGRLARLILHAQRGERN